MTRTISFAAALGALTAAGAIAGEHAMMDDADLIRSRDITGGPVLSLGEGYVEDNWLDDGYTYEYDPGYDQIGSIEDVVLDASGQMVGIVAEIGGFLDIGDKHVMLSVEDVRLVPVDDTSYAFVTRLSEEALEELPGVDEGPLD